MEILQKDPQKAEEEAKKKDYAKRREEFIEVLKKDANFQEFVVRGIIQKEIGAHADIRGIPAGDVEQMRQLVLAKRFVIDTLDRIIRQITP